MYENFLQRFFKYDHRISRPLKSEFIQLIESENNGSHDFERRFTEIQEKLNKALAIFEEKELLRLHSSSNVVPVLLAMVANSKNTADLSKFLNSALSHTEQYMV